MGTLAFSYAGDRSGSYVVGGEIALDAERRPQFGTWAAALPDAEGDIQIAASQARNAPEATVFLLALNNITAPGTYPIDLDCTQETRSSCAIGFFAFGYNWANVDESPEALYFVADGSVTVTEIDGGRVRGTFRGEGPRLPGGSGTTISFSDGNFDVPVVRNTLQVRRNRLIAGGRLGAFRPF